MCYKAMQLFIVGINSVATIVLQCNSFVLEVYHNDQMCATTTILPPSEPDQHVVPQTTDSVGTSDAVS